MKRAIVFGLFLLVVLAGCAGQQTPLGAPASPSPREVLVLPTPRPSPAPIPYYLGRDPFRPLISAEAGTFPPASPGAPPPEVGLRVALLDVFEENGVPTASVRVGGNIYKVHPGEVFAENFKLLDLSGECGNFLHGDVRFRLCKGEEILK